MQNVDSFDRERRPVVRGEYAAREAALAAAESLRWHGDSAADTREYEQRDADRGSHVEEGRERVGGKGGVGQLVDTRFEDRQRTPRGSYQQHDNLQRASLAQRSELYSMGADDRRAFVEANPEKLESPVGDGCTKLQAYRYEVNREPNTRGPAARKPRVVKNVMNQTRQARISLPAEKVSYSRSCWSYNDWSDLTTNRCHHSYLHGSTRLFLAIQATLPPSRHPLQKSNSKRLLLPSFLPSNSRSHRL